MKTNKPDNHIVLSRARHERIHNKRGSWQRFWEKVRDMAEISQRRAARDAQNETAPGNDGRSSETTTTEATDQACPPGNGDK